MTIPGWCVISGALVADPRADWLLAPVAAPALPGGAACGWAAAAAVPGLGVPCPARSELTQSPGEQIQLATLCNYEAADCYLSFLAGAVTRL